MLEILFERTWLQIKGMRTMFLVPFIGYYIVIPLGVWAMAGNPDFVLSDAIADMCYLIVPFLSTWWIYLIVKEYVEGNGREVLLLGKGTFCNAIIFFIANTLCFIPLLYVDVDYRFYPNMVDLTEQLVIISFFMGGLAYFLNYLTKNISASMFLIIIYTAVSNYRFSNERFSKILGKIQLTNMRNVPYDGNDILYWQFIILGIIFWVLGVTESRKVE